jgi:hypothetical protein
MVYDYILQYEPAINEHERVATNKIPSQTKGFSQYWNADDPKMYNAFTFGNAIRQALNNMGNGFSAEVTDFKKWVVVKANHHNSITGKTSSKTFLIVFQKKGDGMVLSTHNRYRSISGADQAISYIKSVINSLQNDTQNRIS